MRSVGAALEQFAILEWKGPLPFAGSADLTHDQAASAQPARRRDSPGWTGSARLDANRIPLSVVTPASLRAGPPTFAGHNGDPATETAVPVTVRWWRW